MEDSEAMRIGKQQWRSSDRASISSRRASGGLCTLWDRHESKLYLSLHSTNWLLTGIIHQKSSKKFNVFNVYMYVACNE
jgi:hypothetical protein